MTRSVCIAFLVLVLGAAVATATTWNEPWQEEVIRLADSFIKVKITEVGPAGCKADVLKSLAGAQAPQQIELSGFSKLNLTSISSGQSEVVLPFRQGEIYYLLVKKNTKTNSYQIPTPTSGYAPVKESTVRAAYRHSYHQALVPEDIYERTMAAVFNGLHGQPFDSDFVSKFVQAQLTSPVAELGTDEATNQRFFLQHVALEISYLLKIKTDLAQLAPFLEAKTPHAQISACRAISVIESPAARETLMKFIEGKGNGFAKVMCVWGLKRLNAKEMISRLQSFLRSGEDQETGFGGSIMDPRVGTYFPDSVKSSIRELLEEWGQRVSKP